MNRVSTTESDLFQKEKLDCLPLSQREFKIARLLAWGYTQKEIANKLFLSPLTVSVHMRNIYKHLDIHKETDLTRWYLFKEYCIDDDPFKKIVAILFLVLSITMVLTEQNTMRTCRSRAARRMAEREIREIRTSRARKVYDLQFA